MTEIPPYGLAAVVVLARVLLGALVLVVLVGMIELVSLSSEYSFGSPSNGDLRVPLVGGGLAIAVCVEVVLVVIAMLVGATRGDRIFGTVALRLVDVLIIAIAVATVITGALLFIVQGPLPPFYLLVVSLLGGLALVLVLLALRSLLHRAAFMHTELDEVV